MPEPDYVQLIAQVCEPTRNPDRFEVQPHYYNHTPIVANYSGLWQAHMFYDTDLLVAVATTRHEALVRLWTRVQQRKEREV